VASVGSSSASLRFGYGSRFREHACKLGLEGVISKRADRPYAPGDRGVWVKSKCLNREEFVVVGWTDPEGSRSHIGALLLGYYTEDGRLRYAGRAGTGMTEKELKAPCGGAVAAAAAQDAAG
jgi:bifunctional non-homologous end joining protein LigD